MDSLKGIIRFPGSPGIGSSSKLTRNIGGAVDIFSRSVWLKVSFSRAKG